jgi:signal transduction histidine kinase
VTQALFTIEIAGETDLVLARTRARQIAAVLGFEAQDQTRVAIAVSEIARNAVQYAGAGQVRFAIEQRSDAGCLVIEVLDQGPGIVALEPILDGSYRSASGAGAGINAARRLMDRFEIASQPGAGVSVRMEKDARGSLELTPELHVRISAELARAPDGLLAEMRQQNKELARALEELRQSQRDLELLNRELEETNRGVMVLYNELEEKAESLRRSNASKSRFFSEMNHEVRTPINSILKLSELLLTGALGDAQPEQSTALGYIQQSARQLSELVDDLLDLAKSEAGKLVVRPSSFTVVELFGGLRGMFRPLHTRDEVKLVFEEVELLPPLHNDQGKVAQILRNFISNALKFTDQGSVTVSARLVRDTVAFSVRDTGIGIDSAQHKTLFEPFTQIDSPRQRYLKGTGLGLSLTRALSELLGGSVEVKSALGRGSTFTAYVPCVYQAAHPRPLLENTERTSLQKILLIDDDEVARFLLRGALAGAGRAVLEANGGAQGLEMAREEQPQLIFLDLQMPEMNGFEVLDALAADPRTSRIPVAIHTSQRLSPAQQQQLASRTIGTLGKEPVSHAEGMAELAAMLERAGLRDQITTGVE